MDLFNRIITTVFDILLSPFAKAEPIWGLAFVAVVTGAAMIWLFGRISNQRQIRRLKATMKGHLLEVWIFRDQLPNVLRAEGRVLRQTGRYILCSLPAFFVLMIPVLMIMIQLQSRYGYRPLRPGEHAVLRIVTADPSTDPSGGSLADATLQVPEGLALETPALRIPRKREIDFRIRALQPGRCQLGIEVAGETITKSVEVGTSCGALSPRRSGRLVDRILNPGEAGLPAGRIVSAEIKYPSETILLGSLRIHWVWPFLAVSIAAGYALKGIFRVEI